MRYYQSFKCLQEFLWLLWQINGSKNAAYLALQIMAIKHDKIKEKLLAYRKDMEKQAMSANEEVIAKYK